MLVLSRKPNERIVVSGVIRITVLDIRGDEVRIGIEAPAGVSIVWDESPPPPDRPEDEAPAGGEGSDSLAPR
jgi:carbon storage regulator